MGRRQRLSPEEELELKAWCQKLEEWGWPARISQLEHMAKELLKLKGDTKKLGKNWTTKWLKRYPEMKSKFVPPLDKSRAMAQNAGSIGRYFLLYDQIVQDYDIQLCDTYNMDEKGVMMGIIGENRVIVTKDERWRPKSYVTQCGSREWVSLIAYCSADGRKLPLWVIFKGVKMRTDWLSYLPPGSGIAMTENGWTDNEIGYEWFERQFEPETRKTLKGKYRLLILDGHASHISTKVIKFCIAHNIILLCLPPHSTHLLQPEDIGLFGPLSTYYKNLIRELCEFKYDEWNIDKVQFCKVITKAFELAFTFENVSSAWEKAGITNYEFREAILSKLRAEDAARVLKAERDGLKTPPEVPGLDLSTKTPQNVREVEKIQEELEVIFGSLKLEDHPDLFEYRNKVEKLSKATKSSMARAATIQRDFDVVHQAQATTKSQKDNKNNHSGWDKGEARVMDAKVLEEREAAKLKKLQEEEITKMMNFPIFIGTEKQREKQKKADLKARKRELTPWQIANITREKEQRLHLVQEFPFGESLEDSSSSKAPSKQPKPPKALLKAPHLPPQPQLQPTVLKSSRGRTLKPAAKLLQQ